jgi:hypothetical protein
VLKARPSIAEEMRCVAWVAAIVRGGMGDDSRLCAGLVFQYHRMAMCTAGGEWGD